MDVVATLVLGEVVVGWVVVAGFFFVCAFGVDVELRLTGVVETFLIGDGAVVVVVLAVVLIGIAVVVVVVVCGSMFAVT